MIVLGLDARSPGSQSRCPREKPHERGARETEKEIWKRNREHICILNIEGEMTDIHTGRERERQRQWGERKKGREIYRQIRETDLHGMGGERERGRGGERQKGKRQCLPDSSRHCHFKRWAALAQVGTICPLRAQNRVKAER